MSLPIFRQRVQVVTTILVEPELGACVEKVGAGINDQIVVQFFKLRDKVADHVYVAERYNSCNSMTILVEMADAVQAMRTMGRIAELPEELNISEVPRVDIVEVTW